jgi:hypothetical protein
MHIHLHDIRPAVTSNLDCSRCSMWGSSWILTSASGSTTLALTRHWALRTKCRAVCQAETNGMFAQFRHLKGSLKPFNHAHSLGMIRRIKDAFCFFLFVGTLFFTLTDCWSVQANHTAASQQAMLFMDLYWGVHAGHQRRRRPLDLRGPTARALGQEMPRGLHRIADANVTSNVF